MDAWRGVEVPELPGNGTEVRLRDTATGELTVAASGHRASLYACGITPYDATHMGHAATFTAWDLLVRAWLDAGHEVVPRDALIARAYAIADHIMTQPRTVRRLTTQIVRRPWKQRIVNDLDGGFGIQMFGHVAKKKAVHGEEHIRGTVDYVREGRKNNFD